MNSIDLHTHILPEQIPNFKEKFGVGGFITLAQGSCNNIKRMIKDNGEFFREIHSNCWDPQIRIKECQEFGVTIQALSTIPIMFNYWVRSSFALEISQFINDHLFHIVKQYPQHFVAMGTIPMQDTNLACLELKRIVNELGFSSIQIGTNVNGQNLSEKQFWPIFELAEKLNVSIFIHPWNMMGQDEMKSYWLPWLVGMPAESSRAACSLIFSGILDAFPNLKIGLAHGGGSFPATIGRINHAYHCRPDLCAQDNKHEPIYYKKRFILDSLVHDENQLKFLVNQFGCENIGLGSDYPFPLGELSPGKMIRLTNLITEDQKKWILWKTNAKFLNIKESEYGI